MNKLISASGVGMFLLGTSLAFGVMYSSQTLSKALVKMRQDNMIRVKGVSEEKITSNYATWRCLVSAKSSDLAQAFMKIERSRNSAAEYLKASGISDGQLSTGPISTCYEFKHNEKTGEKTNVIENYVLRQTLEVKSHDVRKIDNISKSVTDLIKQGIEISSLPPEYVNLGIEDIKLNLLAKATKNGYERAEILAKNSGGKVGSLNSASQGVFQITSANSTEVDDYGRYDTCSIEKSARAVVTLEFRIEK